MVSSTSTTSQVEERRRKTTYERAKVVHLSRQLQLRLQYARLKVEHGWHKQNLNEVENLYFRHSHTKPRSSLRDLPLLTCPVIPQTLTTFNTTEAHADTQMDDGDQDSSESIEADPATPQNFSPSPHPSISKSPIPATPEEPAVPALQPSPIPIDSTPLTPSQTPESRTHHPPFSAVPQLTPAPKAAPETVPTYPITSYYGALLANQSPVTYGTRYGQLPSIPPTSQRPITIPAGAQTATPAQIQASVAPATTNTTSTASPSAPDPFKFGTAATASLTYDSFWSSHLASRSRVSLTSRSSENLLGKPSVANPSPRRTTDIAQALSGILAAGGSPMGVVQGAAAQQPQPQPQPHTEVSSRV
ncbi:hypothetical protein V5O48_000783 [Marasmius crinis-equi]|uniref:Uncharacterized protein n=1 Tax=Marasmius crinis-equi TaxID=585013 RepID=A0ABR3G0D8_9AGAR